MTSLSRLSLITLNETEIDELQHAVTASVSSTRLLAEQSHRDYDLTQLTVRLLKLREELLIYTRQMPTSPFIQTPAILFCAFQAMWYVFGLVRKKAEQSVILCMF